MGVCWAKQVKEDEAEDGSPWEGRRESMNENIKGLRSGGRPLWVSRREVQNKETLIGPLSTVCFSTEPFILSIVVSD
jgi:hypothetical protein